MVPTRAEDGARAILDGLFELGRHAVAQSRTDWDAIGAVGIACGGPLDASRGTVSPLHIPAWHELPLVSLTEEAYGRATTLEHDASAAAAGEHRFGAGAGTANMVYLTISTGVGGGVVIDGRLYRGSMGNGAELGHITVDWRGRRCRGCGRLGCLEAYVSGTSIAERAREAGMDDPGGRLRATDVAERARDGNSLARSVWDETVAALACGVTSIVNAFEPEAVVLGGGVSRLGEQLLEPVRAAVHADALTPAGRTVQIVPASLGEHVGVVGAAAVAFSA